MLPLPEDYLERVYAGVLGKMTGVYLGRPFEGWTYERIMETLGEVDYYVNDRLPGKPPLVVTDDDLSGTFVFLRALREHGFQPDISPAQIGDTWLNNLIEEKTILWWGGLGCSTEHTAYLRLKQGIRAPLSGSAALNGRILAEQIGAQIFIDGWAMLFPGDPERAADYARRAASVSHDGEAVCGAQVIAAMEAQAFVEKDIQRLLDTAASLIPRDSTLCRMIGDVREWHAGEPDWHRTRARIAEVYGYDRYRGVCHVIPNHALIILGLLYGEGDFQRSMRVVNTSGWDTDCNAGNLGCLLGIRTGMTAFEGGPDWLGPLNDRLFTVSAQGGEAITDALRISCEVANAATALRGLPVSAYKHGARFHFEAPGSTQGFRAQAGNGNWAEVKNTGRHSRAGKRSLWLRWSGGLAAALTPVFILPEEREISWYPFLASPGLYSGQILQAGIHAETACQVSFLMKIYNSRDELVEVHGPQTEFQTGEDRLLTWQVTDTQGQPAAMVGIAVESGEGVKEGSVYLDWLTWTGSPRVKLGIPPEADAAAGHAAMWRRAWVNAADQWNVFFPEAYRLSQNRGRGLLIQGTREWQNYEARAVIRSPLCRAGGVAVRVQGMRRYYALLLTGEGTARLVKMLDTEYLLAERPFIWQPETEYELRLRADGSQLRAWIDGQPVFEAEDREDPLKCGGVALVIEEGHLTCNEVSIDGINEADGCEGEIRKI